MRDLGPHVDPHHHIDPHHRADLEDRLERALDHARALCHSALRLRGEALVAQLSSRPRQRFGAVDGRLDGVATSAVVFCDGTMAGDRALAERVRALGDPLIVTVDLARALTKVCSVGITRAGCRRRRHASPLGSGAGLSASAQQATHRTPREWSDGVLSVRTVEAGGACVLYLRGELDVSSAGALRDALSSVDGPVVLDLCELTFIDARGVTVVVGAHRDGLEGGNPLTVRGARGLVRRVFGLCGYDELVDGSGRTGPGGETPGTGRRRPE